MSALALGIQGKRTEYGPVIEILYDNGHTRELKHVVRHSPTGMNWGYGGSGPADLALSILTYACKKNAIAERYHLSFKWAFIAGLPDDKWFIPLTVIRNWLCEQMAGTE